MSIPDQIVSYSKFTSQRTDLPESSPQWVYEQRLSYPHHLKHSELISAYTEAKKRYDRCVEVVQFGINQRMAHPGNSQMDESLKQSQQQVKEAEAALKQAEQTLQEFNNHTPEQRIALYEAEIASLEIELMEAHAVEHEFTENLLNDPNAAKKRLDRIVHGYTGTEAEYSPEQLTQVRSLRSRVDSLSGKITNHQRDIAKIHQLVAEEEHRLEVQGAMDEALATFNEACTSFADAWKELQGVAKNYGIRILEGELQLPKSAVFRPAQSKGFDSTLKLIRS